MTCRQALASFHATPAVYVDATRAKQTFAELVDSLPNRVFMTIAAWGDQPYLVWDDRLLAWSPGGYGDPRPRPLSERVRVLTPKSTSQ
jgi:hypothetical protein